MKCLYCGEHIDIGIAEHNVLSYGGVVRIASPCCGKPIGVKRRMILDYFITSHDSDTDDWGTAYVKEGK